jgi:glycosyltransferase involved in cell wall biosynthesis
VISVVIPAHDEENVIGRCLAGLLRGIERPDELDVVVVCNGCRDGTAAVAARFGPPVRVVETPVASKPAALDRGDAAAVGFPRFYLDADAELSGTALLEVAARLQAGDVLAAAPRLEVELDGRPWPIRAYYRVWSQLPYMGQDLIGSGVYALSEAGRRRFDRFPAIIADDLFVRNLFAPGERVSLDTCSFTVRPPRTLSALVRSKSRARAGDLQYRRLYGSGTGSRPGTARALCRLARQPGTWPGLGVYVAVSAATWARAAGKVRRGDLGSWDRDETARRS